MYLIVEENPNCQPEERVFAVSGEPRAVSRVKLLMTSGDRVWCDIVGIDDKEEIKDAVAVTMDDSGAGTAWLITGAAWGLRLRRDADPWSVNNPKQWGLPFLVLDGSGQDIEWK